jgi:TetR/AcrR family transcriptional regulator, lmrAB and yxaGH operons repressor
MDKPHPKEALISAATRLFRERGYAGVGVAELLEVSGAPRGSLYFHFPRGKEQIAEEAVMLSGERMDKFFAKVVGETEDLEAFLDGLFLGWAQHMQDNGFARGCGVALIALETSAHSDRLRAATETVFKLWRGRLASVGLQRGLTPSAAERFGFMVLGAMQGAIVLAKASQSTKPLGEAAFAMKAAVGALRTAD